MAPVVDMLDFVRALAAAPAGGLGLEYDEAWAAGAGRGAVVGVVDTGFDAANADLAGASIVARDLVGVPDAEPELCAHGTGSLILLVGQGRRVRGVAPRATVLAARVIGPGGVAVPARVAAGIDWLVAEGVQIVALPLGDDDDYPEIAGAIERGADAGVRFFAAGGSGPGAVLFPARHPRVIAVAAAGSDGAAAKDARLSPRIDCIAPGGPSVGSGRGSSVACVIAAGVAALGHAARRLA